ncbi:MAG: hypothetical protein PHN57_06065 [Candidatus Omnitrophica bacterium]|nr:hypothetical protein [Candidatus Omnitrophota bacterium]
MAKKTLLTGLLICLSLGVYGCTTYYQDSSYSKSQGLLEPSATVKFIDVPVPAGFKAIPQNSYSFESSGVRVGVLKYHGKADPDQVVNFYKEQMPINNWHLLNVIEYGERVLNFDRENETCIVSLQAKGNSVTLTISVGPKSQAPARKTKDSLKEPLK